MMRLCLIKVIAHLTVAFVANKLCRDNSLRRYAGSSQVSRIFHVSMVAHVEAGSFTFIYKSSPLATSPVARLLQLLILDDFNPVVVGIEHERLCLVSILVLLRKAIETYHVLHPAICQPLLPIDTLALEVFTRFI